MNLEVNKELSEKYLEMVKRQISKNYIFPDDINKSILFHSIIGLVTESGELMDNMKKHLFYKKDIDEVNIDEELGDIYFYTVAALISRGKNLSDILEINMKKIFARFPNGFNEKDALNRNLDKERMILEKKYMKKAIELIDYIKESNTLENSEKSILLREIEEKEFEKDTIKNLFDKIFELEASDKIANFEIIKRFKEIAKQGEKLK
jgi:NTP pyrophosphatase (non-canonical NTP hydrolase)